MRISLSPFLCGKALLVVLVFGPACNSSFLAQAPAAGSAPAAGAAPATGGQVGPSAERVNVLAHRLLTAAAKVNGLSGEGLKPWHMKVDFQMVSGAGPNKPVAGTLEEWYLDRYHWRRTYSSSEPTWSGSEWRVGKAHRYVTKRRHFEFEDYWLTSRVGRPVINPLYQVDDIRPEDALLVQRETTNGVTMNCTSLAHPTEQYGRKPEWIVPTMCFDTDLHVRIMRSEDIVGQFFDLQPFQGRNMARDVQLLVGGHLFCEMKVTLLETVDKLDEALPKPDAEASERPFAMESGDPQPVATYQVGAAIPLITGYPPYRGSMAFPVIIHKDGSIKVEGSVGRGPLRYIWDAISNTVGRWKYEPYVVEGEPVEVEFRVIYNVDGKPFVPVVGRQ